MAFISRFEFILQARTTNVTIKQWQVDNTVHNKIERDNTNLGLLSIVRRVFIVFERFNVVSSNYCAEKQTTEQRIRLEMTQTATSIVEVNTEHLNTVIRVYE